MKSRINKRSKSKRARYLSYGVLLLFVAVVWFVLPDKLRNWIEPKAYAATFIVNSTNDGGDINLADNICDADPLLPIDCTLRAAIQEANDNPGADIINFNVPVSLFATIALNSPLPAITEQVTINGFTQPGASPNTLINGQDSHVRIVLDGESAGSGNGLNISASNCVVKGLAITNFNGAGISIIGNANAIQGNYIGLDGSAGKPFPGISGNGVSVNPGSKDNLIGGTSPAARNLISGNGAHAIAIFNGSSDTQVQGNFIGTSYDGSQLLSNGGIGVRIVGSANNTIGGNTSGARNVISGNGESGVFLFGNDTAGNKIQGNYIGTDATGINDRGNTLYGVIISGGAHDNLVGGTDQAVRNVISGNVSGVHIEGDMTTGNLVQGNYIGTNVSGTEALPNLVGVRVFAAGNIIGGTGAGARNVISGNTEAGIGLSASTKVQGNFIGTKANGTEALGNAVGVGITGGEASTIGGTETGARNIISGNKVNGVGIAGTSATHVVQGNFIGTDVSGNAALGNSVNGVRLFGASNCLIGGATGGARNVISANGADGIRMEQGSTGNKVQGNFIGTNATGAAALGNAGSGVIVEGGSTAPKDNVIGGTEAGAGNLISGNMADGVGVGTLSTGNRILSNSIHSNGQLGIDLFPDSVTPNDTGDGDTGANNLQNFPVLTAAASNAGLTVISGTLNSEGSKTYRIEIFSNPSCDPSAHGEGHRLIDVQEVTTDAGGNASIIAAAPTSVLSGQFITATATDPAGNTSEFCQCVQATAGGPSPTPTPTPTPSPTPFPSPTSGTLQFGQAIYFVQEDCAEVIVNVSRTGDSTNAATVEYSTVNGTANERSDFTTARGVLRFAAGETAKSFGVLITEDSRVEGSENFTVALSNAGGATIGSPAIATIEISDDSPEQTVNPVDVAEQFVCQHYHDFLNREDDLTGLNFWTNEIESCGADLQCREVKRVNVSAAFFLSIEFQETGGLVIRTQRAAFGKKSDTAGSRVSYNQFIEESREVGEGVVVLTPGWEQKLETNRQLYAERIVRLADFINKYPLSMTAEAYVDALIATSGLALTSAERQAASSAFGGGGTTGRAAALRKVADSETLRAAELRPAFVLMQYFGYLRRNPTDPPDTDDSGYQFWLAKLNQFNGDFAKAEMVRAFILSFEYRGRFGQP